MGHGPVYFIPVFVLIFLNLNTSSYAIDSIEDERNVGTVLFDKTNANDYCWNNEEFVVLSSRKIFQDLLPKIEPLNIRNDEYIAELLSYFQVCVENVCRRSTGRTKRLMLRSLADTMGGYLQSYAVPITKVSYYAGNVEYCNADKVVELLARLKQFLRTDAAGWAKPGDMEMYINVTPAALSTHDYDACDKLVVNDKFLRKRRKNTRQVYRPKKKRREPPQRYVIVEDAADRNYQQSSLLFLPYLDNDLNPNSIAVPFKHHDLWSLFDKDSVAILTRYYELCVNCISSTGAADTQRHLDDFNRDFYQWLLQSVYPRLNDDKWYPAFGGVLRIIALLRDTVRLPTTIDEDIVVETSTRAQDPTTLEDGYAEVEITPQPIDADKDSSLLGTTELIIIAISSAVVVWLVVGIALVCYKYLRKKERANGPCSPCDSPRSDVAMLYENDNFLDDCPSTSSRKSISQQVRDWWMKKFKACPGGCGRTAEREECLAAMKFESKESVGSSKRSFKRRKKKFRSVAVSASPSSSPCAHYVNNRFHYSSDMSSSCSDSSYR